MKEATVKADYMKAVYADLDSTVGDVFSSMAGAAKGALENFILAGEGGVAAFASLSASGIASLAIQSGIKTEKEFRKSVKC